MVHPVLKKVASRAFLAGDRLGVHVLPSHYYSSVASRRTLRQTESLWRHPLDPMPFTWDVDRQAEWLALQAGSYPGELPLDHLAAASESVGGLRYGPIEAQFLYSFLRSNAPERVVEIGSGSSTLVMSEAVVRNVAEGRAATQIVACDPYTAERVALLPHVSTRSIGGLEISTEVLDLSAGDLLFIDSTHTVRTGSELSHLYLELVPRLSPGVIIHIHDIYFPYLYCPDLYTSMFDWQESTLVAALLSGNSSLSVLASMSGLHHGRPDLLRKTFPEYRPRALVDGLGGDDGEHFPSSLWLMVS